MRKYTKSQLAEKLYNQKLKEIENMMGKDNTTFLKELDGVGNKLFGVKYKGTFPSDKIPKLNDLAPYCILNLDRSNEPGSHWIALAKDVNNDRCLVYDSFGITHTKIIPNLRFSGNGRVIDADRDKEQHPKETNCGQRCLGFIAIYDKFGYDIAKLI